MLSSFGAGHVRHVHRSSGMISFDLIGNQENGLGKQWVEKLGQTAGWLMDGLYLCLWVDAPARLDSQSFRFMPKTIWHLISTSTGWSYRIISYLASSWFLPFNDCRCHLAAVGIQALLIIAFIANIHINSLYLICRVNFKLLMLKKTDMVPLWHKCRQLGPKS